MKTHSFFSMKLLPLATLLTTFTTATLADVPEEALIEPGVGIVDVLEIGYTRAEVEESLGSNALCQRSGNLLEGFCTYNRLGEDFRSVTVRYNGVNERDGAAPFQTFESSPEDIVESISLSERFTTSGWQTVEGLTAYSLIANPAAISEAFPDALVVERFDAVDQVRASNIHWGKIRPGYNCRTNCGFFGSIFIFEEGRF